jgi:hypothetical protein
MEKLALEITGEPIIGNAGLAVVCELMRISGIDSSCAKRESPNYQVAEKGHPALSWGPHRNRQGEFRPRAGNSREANSSRQS